MNGSAFSREIDKDIDGLLFNTFMNKCICTVCGEDRSELVGDGNTIVLYKNDATLLAEKTIYKRFYIDHRIFSMDLNINLF